LFAAKSTEYERSLLLCTGTPFYYIESPKRHNVHEKGLAPPNDDVDFLLIYLKRFSRRYRL
jgi:hypothetical protein